MRIRLGELRRLLANLLKEGPGGGGFHDSYFVEDIMPMLKEQGNLPEGIGGLIGYGNEAVVFQFGTDRVIRLHPTYEDDEDRVDEVFNRMQNAPSGGGYAEVFDVGKIKGYDEERGEDVTYAVYAVMERLSPITHEEAEIIDAVVTGQMTIDQLDATPELASFLQKYVTLPIDQDSRNVMKRGDQYIIIDPE